MLNDTWTISHAEIEERKKGKKNVYKTEMTNLNIYKYIIFPDCGCWMGGLSGGVEVRKGEMGGNMVRGGRGMG